MQSKSIALVAMLAAIAVAIPAVSVQAFAEEQEAGISVDLSSLATFTPILVSVVYGAFGFAHAKTKGEAWDGDKFFRSVAVGIVIMVGAALFQLEQTAAVQIFETVGVILIDQIVKIYQAQRARAKAAIAAATAVAK